VGSGERGEISPVKWAAAAKLAMLTETAATRIRGWVCLVRDSMVRLLGVVRGVRDDNNA
jgi:hypothetical protein